MKNLGRGLDTFRSFVIAATLHARAGPTCGIGWSRSA